jgi:hypothetical protein
LQQPRVVVTEAVEDSYADDVEWPLAEWHLLVEQAGLGIGYREADGLSYRIAEDFGSASDVHDDDPLR